MEIKQAIETLIKAIKEDEEYRRTWQANIAMAFKDEMAKWEFGTRIDMHKDDLHEVANKAANNFLDVLTK